MLKTMIKFLTFFLAMFIGLGAYSVWYLRENNSALLEQIKSQPLIYQRTAPAPIADFEPAESPKLAECENPNPLKKYKYPRNNRTINGGVLNGKLVCRVFPNYPPAAWEKRISGQVVVDVLVDEIGDVVKASVKSGNPYLHQVSLMAARQSRTAPWLLGGEPVNVRGTLIYNFDYNSESLNPKPSAVNDCPLRKSQF